MGTTYRPGYLPATREIRETFTDVITSVGGVVSDVFENEDRLFARAVLPADGEIRPGDRVRAGVAVRAAGPEIQVHPYTFRQVCSNGAIASHTLQSRCLERVYSEVFASTYECAVLQAKLRDAVQACAAREAFDVVADEMRAASEVEADFALDVLPGLARLPERLRAQLEPYIFRGFAAASDRSVFGLLNVVTAIARDTRDHDTRWRLEELGGTIPARLGPQPRIKPAVSALSGV